MKHISLLALCCPLFLAACGGGGSNTAPAAPATSTPETPIQPTFQASAVIAGLEGSINLEINGQIITLTENGTHVVASQLNEGASVNVQIAQSPFRQTCTLNDASPRVINQADINNIEVTCVPLGKLVGRVQNYYTGDVLENISVTLATQVNGETLTVAQATTQSDGHFEINGIGRSDRFVLTAFGNGFGSSSAIFESTTDTTTTLDTLLLRAHLANTFSPSAAQNLAVNGNTIVSLPANGLVDESGLPATGNVNATITLIDPSSDPTLMPGGYETRNQSTGEILPIESFGAINVELRSDNGTELQLAPGSTATIRIPVAQNVAGSPPQTIPLYHFDEVAGYWIEEGEATLTQDNGMLFYVGTVSHFSTWNADRVYETIRIKGCVADREGNRLANVRIRTSGRNYIGNADVITDAQGEFSVPAKMNAVVLLSGQSGTESKTRVLSTLSADQQLESCLVLAPSAATIKLTWGENPEDLDSHLYGPKPNGSGFHIYYSRKTATINETVIELDVDDTNSFGPEIISIPDFPEAGVYQYAVHLYYGSGTIKTSPARVELNLQGTSYIFSPENASGDSEKDYWHVFNLIADAAGNVSLSTVQEFKNSIDASASYSALSVTSEPQNLSSIATKQKYYRSSEAVNRSSETNYRASEPSHKNYTR